MLDSQPPERRTSDRLAFAIRDLEGLVRNQGSQCIKLEAETDHLQQMVTDLRGVLGDVNEALKPMSTMETRLKRIENIVYGACAASGIVLLGMALKRIFE